VIDLVGYNYINQSNPDEQHAKFPHQPGVGTEEATMPGTRGIYVEDPPRAHVAFLSPGDTGGNLEKGWKYYAGRPFLAGLFFWTGFDYRGEPMKYGWPEIYAQSGLYDGCGFPKDTAYYLKSWWTDEPVLHLYPHWNWAGREGQETAVVCFSNHEAVELFLNGVSLGKKDMPRNGHLEWKVAYAPGALEARGYRGGKVVATTRVETTGAPAQLVLTPDRTVINADGADAWSSPSPPTTRKGAPFRPPETWWTSMSQAAGSSVWAMAIRAATRRTGSPRPSRWFRWKTGAVASRHRHGRALGAGIAATFPAPGQLARPAPQARRNLRSGRRVHPAGSARRRQRGIVPSGTRHQDQPLAQRP